MAAIMTEYESSELISYYDRVAWGSFSLARCAAAALIFDASMAHPMERIFFSVLGCQSTK